MSTETTFLQNGDITVTNARFIVGSQTYAMRGITSVKGIKITPGKVSPILLMIFGMVLMLTRISLLAFIGIAAIGVGIYWLVKQKPAFAVVLTTASGEMRAYESTDSEMIGDVLEALNQAIVAHS